MCTNRVRPSSPRGGADFEAQGNRTERTPLQASRHTVHVSRPTFTPDPDCGYRPVYDLAVDMALTLAYDDGDLFRPPMIPAESVEMALSAGYVLLDQALLNEESDGDSFIALLGDNLHRLGTHAILGQHGTHDELDAAHSVLDGAYRLHSECIDPEDEPHFFQAVEQAEAHVDRLGWEALVWHKITALPSLLFAFLTTDEPTRAVRVCT